MVQGAVFMKGEFSFLANNIWYLQNILPDTAHLIFNLIKNNLILNLILLRIQDSWNPEMCGSAMAGGLPVFEWEIIPLTIMGIFQF